MKNPHLRFGGLTYFTRTEKTTTAFRLRMDRFIGEVEPIHPVRPAHISYQLLEEIRRSGL